MDCSREPLPEVPIALLFLACGEIPQTTSPTKQHPSAEMKEPRTHKQTPNKGPNSEYTMQGEEEKYIPFPPGCLRSGVTVAVMSGQTA
jgi:hypothetical protein